MISYLMYEYLILNIYYKTARISMYSYIMFVDCIISFFYIK